MEPCSPTNKNSKKRAATKPSSSSSSSSSSLDYSQNDFEAGFGGGVCLDRCNGYAAELELVDSYSYRYYMSGEVGSGKCSEIVANSDKGSCDASYSKCCKINLSID